MTTLPGTTPLPWHVSDSHGLCIVNSVTGELVADLSPDRYSIGWHGKAGDARLAVEAVNSHATHLARIAELERLLGEACQHLSESAHNVTRIAGARIRREAGL